jgi:hypothetical protein
MEFVILEVHRFEGVCDPDDTDVLYAIARRRRWRAG